jgi:hypothetical protein
LLDHAGEVGEVGEVGEATRQLGMVEGPGAQMVEEATFILHDLHLLVSELVSTDKSIVARVASAAEFNSSPLCDGHVPAREYNPDLLKSRYLVKRYIVVGPDRFLFAACRDIAELSKPFEAVNELLDFDGV